MEKNRVLYIDDSAVEREVVQRILEDRDFVILVTGSPDEGIELARRMKPDLILLDLHIPEMDGCAINERLRNMSQLESVPIIALSASINDEEKEEALDYFDGFIEKPVDVDLFPDQIHKLIEAGRQEKGLVIRSSGGEKPKLSPAEGEEEVLKALEKIRAAVSHDLRTPLTVMISYASTVGREKVGTLNDRQREMLDLVVEQGFQLDALISELVRIARETLDRYDYPPK